MRPLVLPTLTLMILGGTACSDIPSPTDPQTTDPAVAPFVGGERAVTAGFIKFDGVDGECQALGDEMLRLSAGEDPPAVLIGLLLPAVQKVRAAVGEAEERGDEVGTPAKEAFRILRVAVLSHNPPGDTYKLRDLIVTSIMAMNPDMSERTARQESLNNLKQLGVAGKDFAANAESLLFHVFNGLSIELTEGDAGADLMPRIESILALVAELSDDDPTGDRPTG